MLIKKIAIGDKNEAFIESRLNDGVNIIFSDDNNRGKTIVMQGLMYSLGYESAFPSTFEYKDKYFYSEVNINNIDYAFLRKRNSIAVKRNETIFLFNSINEFKYFFDKNIFKIPKIEKDNKTLSVDLTLLYEIFFLGQDNRKSSTINNQGLFNKTDFKQMLLSLIGLGLDVDLEDAEKIKSEIKLLKIKLDETLRKIELTKLNPNVAEMLFKSANDIQFNRKLSNLQNIHSRISEILKSRQREANRKIKLINLKSELNSLNRELAAGHVKCAECGSTKITYSNDDFQFDISNIDVKNEIMNSINESIEQKEEIISELTIELNKLQGQLQAELKTTEPRIQQLILYSEEVDSTSNLDVKYNSLQSELGSLTRKLKSHDSSNENNREKIKKFFTSLLVEMNKLYKEIDPNGNMVFEDLFSTKDSIYSGSEGQEFYFCKIIAINNILNHSFPIIIDSFRDGELSTTKENKMLSIYRKLNKQVILTSTLKKEEYRTNKYTSQNVNSIDYSNHKDCKILDKKQAQEFYNIISSFNGLTL